MTSASMDTNRREDFDQAFAKLKEAALILSDYRDDPRVRVVLVQLEGMDEGWHHSSQESDEYLVDLLMDLMLEARGTPVIDHWRGHPMTREEAEAIVGKVAG